MSPLQQQQSLVSRRLVFGPPVKLKQFRAGAKKMRLKQDASRKISAQRARAARGKLMIKQVVAQQASPANQQLGLMLVLIISSTSLIQIASLGNCDNSAAEPKEPHHVPASSEAAVAAGNSLQPEQKSPMPTKQDATNEKSHREKFMQSLAESVIRQHSGGALSGLPPTSSSHKSTTGHHLGPASSGAGSTSNSLPDSYMKLYQTHEQHMTMKKRKEVPVGSVEKGPPGMMDIMSLHMNSPTPSPNPSSAQAPTRKASKWFSEAAGQLHTGPLKALSSVMSVLAPIASGVTSSAAPNRTRFVQELSRFLPASSLFQDHTSQSENGVQKNSRKRASRQHSAANQGLGPAGLALSQLQKRVMGPLLGLGQMMLTSGDSFGAAKSSSLFNSSAPLQEPSNVAPSGQPHSKSHNNNNNNNNKIQIARNPLEQLLGAILRSQGPSFQQKADQSSGGANDMEKSSSSFEQGQPIGPHRNGENKEQNTKSKMGKQQEQQQMGPWYRIGANRIAHTLLKDSLRDWLTLSQLPILPGGPISTAPSELEPGGKQWLAQRASVQQLKGNRTQTLDDLMRYAYIFGSGVRRKRDPLKVLGPSPTNSLTSSGGRLISTVSRRPGRSFFGQRKSSNDNNINNNDSKIDASASNNQLAIAQPYANTIAEALSTLLMKNRQAKPRGVMWEMATDPTLAVTVLSLMEKASVALPLGKFSSIVERGN